MMKIETVIKMIDEYLEEKHTNKEWVEALELCRAVLVEKQNNFSNNIKKVPLKYFEEYSNNGGGV